MITVVDYGRGNLFSLGQALSKLGHPFVITEDPGRILDAPTIILPGVGAFGDAMAQLNSSGQGDAIREAVARGRRLLGICLGMQILASRSEEFGDHLGLGLIDGDVRRLPSLPHTSPGATRIPNVGWRKVIARDGLPLEGGIGPSPYFYFVHSFGFHASDAKHVLATIAINGENIPAIVGRDNIWGFQFHPEKSGPTGLSFLDRFLVMDNS